MRLAWPWYMQLKIDYELHPIAHLAIFTFSNHFFCYGLSFLIMYLIYKSKLEIFERERCQPNE